MNDGRSVGNLGIIENTSTFCAFIVRRSKIRTSHFMSVQNRTSLVNIFLEFSHNTVKALLYARRPAESGEGGGGGGACPGPPT